MSNSSLNPKRLKDLRLAGFKALEGEVHIPLDGDVVLIYGPNGSGKTSILSAIEWALTGAVGDLASFKRDYPGCLRHTSHTGQTWVSLAYADSEGVEHTATQALQAGVDEPGTLTEAQLSRWFVERCYLSQTRLGRLLEAHQNKSSSTQSEFVRFLTALLGLDWVDNLVTGLEKSARADTLQASFGVLRDLDKRITQAEVHFKTTAQEVQGLADDVGERVAAIASMLDQSGFGDCEHRISSVPVEEATAYIVNDLALRVAASESLARGEMKAMQRRVGLARALAAEAETYAGTTGDVEELQSELTGALEDQKSDLSAISLVWQAIESGLPGLRASNLQVADQPVVEFPPYSQCHSLLSQAERDLRQQAQEAASLGALSESLGKTVSELECTIASAEAPASESLTRLEEQSRLLAQIVGVISGTVCPVCERDFSEVSDRPLAESVRDRLATLGTQVEGWRVEIELRVAAMANLEKARQELAVVSRRRSDMEDPEALGKRLHDTTARLSQLAGVEAKWVAYEDRLKHVKSLASRLEAALNASAQMRDLLSRLDQMSSDSGIALIQIDSKARFEEFLSRTQAACATAERRASSISELGAAVTGLARISEEVATAKANLEEAAGSLAALKEHKAATDELSAEAKLVFQRAGRMRADAVERLFSQEFNRIWADMFARLAADEKFIPSGTLKLLRNRLQFDLQAKVPNADDCYSLASILSAGNLNTAALTLFLTLHLMEEPLMPLVILDDPVQSMDDVHLLNFASLLRGLSRDAGRQVVVAVHERALFEYLKAELHPSAPNRSMIAVEISPATDPARSRIQSSQYAWEGDSLAFAASS